MNRIRLYVLLSGGLCMLVSLIAAPTWLASRIWIVTEPPGALFHLFGFQNSSNTDIHFHKVIEAAVFFCGFCSRFCFFVCFFGIQQLLNLLLYGSILNFLK